MEVNGDEIRRMNLMVGQGGGGGAGRTFIIWPSIPLSILIK